LLALSAHFFRPADFNNFDLKLASDYVTTKSN